MRTKATHFEDLPLRTQFLIVAVVLAIIGWLIGTAIGRSNKTSATYGVADGYCTSISHSTNEYQNCMDKMLTSR